MYVANQRLKVGDEYRDVGDPIPEIAEWDWRIRHSFLQNNRVIEVPDTALPAAAQPAEAPKPTKKPTDK